MGKTDRGEHPRMYDDYVVQRVDANWLAERVKPKRHIGLTAELCILCRACEDVCPWECIFMMNPGVIAEPGDPQLGATLAASAAVFLIDDAECTRCAICVERCPTDALWLGRTDGVGTWPTLPPQPGSAAA
jgi:formate hydrogenlyase subunit 6/NADH:ubiquinone oxidoreductase subunit I